MEKIGRVRRPASIVAVAAVTALLMLLLGRLVADGPEPSAVVTGAADAMPGAAEPVADPTPDPNIFDPYTAAFSPIGGPGVRLADGSRGVVQLQVDRHPVQVVRRTDVPRFPRSSAFGAVVLAADLDGDGREDLVVGAGKPAKAGGPTPTGGVHILLGSPKGVNPARDRVIASPGSPGDGFGAVIPVLTPNA